MQEAEKLKKINKEIPTSKFQKGEINLGLRLSLSIRIVADCGLHSCQVTRKLKRATNH